MNLYITALLPLNLLAKYIGKIIFVFHYIFLASITLYCISLRSYGQSDKSSSYFENDILAPWEGGPSYYSKWANGTSSSSNFFPIAVWLQNPLSTNAMVYKNIGVNTYIGLHNGPTEPQLEAIANLSLATICNQNVVGLNSVKNNVIKAWAHIDEPDNAVTGTQIPVPTDTIIVRYNKMKNKDNTRPVYLNFGQGVACDAWYGRGNRTRHPEDYAEYSKGADILSFDVYPMNVFPPLDTDASWKKTFKNEVTQKPWYVANGVKRLREWTNYSKPVWTWIECTNTHGNPSYKLTPSIVKAEVWMALVNGARGIGYFCHQIDPFIEAGMLANVEMSNGISAVNAQITSLAEVLNTQSVVNGFTLVSGNNEISIDAMLKRNKGYTYLFAVATRPGSTEVTFTVNNFSGSTTIEVVGENRTLAFSDGIFKDTFTDFAVHIYKIGHSATSISNVNSFGHSLLNYPNPFRDHTAIRFHVPQKGWVQMDVFDNSWKKISTLVNEEKQVGKYEVIFNASPLQSGTYICRLHIQPDEKNNGLTAYQKMISY